MQSLRIFDFDGVFTPAPESHVRLMNEVLKNLGIELTLTAEHWSRVRDVSSKGILTACGLDEETIQKIRKPFRVGLQNLPSPYLFDGIRDLLTVPPGSYTAIITGNDSEWTRDVLFQHGTKADKIIGGEQPGTKREKIQALLIEFSVDAKNAFYVGDTSSDMKHARDAGVTAIGSLLGIHSEEILRECGAQHIIPSIPALVSLIAELEISWGLADRCVDLTPWSIVETPGRPQEREQGLGA